MLKTWDLLQKWGKEPFSGHKTAESQCVGDGEMESCGRVVLLPVCMLVSPELARGAAWSRVVQQT